LFREIYINTAVETLKRLLNNFIWRAFSWRLPDKISDNTPWLPISGRSACFRPCSYIKRFQPVSGTTIYGGDAPASKVISSKYFVMQSAVFSHFSLRHATHNCCKTKILYIGHCAIYIKP